MEVGKWRFAGADPANGAFYNACEGLAEAAEAAREARALAIQKDFVDALFPFHQSCAV